MNDQINQLHEQAMERMDRALAAKRTGDDAAADAAFHQAFHLERAAAEFRSQGKSLHDFTPWKRPAMLSPTPVCDPHFEGVQLRLSLETAF